MRTAGLAALLCALTSHFYEFCPCLLFIHGFQWKSGSCLAGREEQSIVFLCLNPFQCTISIFNLYCVWICSMGRPLHSWFLTTNPRLFWCCSEYRTLSHLFYSCLRIILPCRHSHVSCVSSCLCFYSGSWLSLLFLKFYYWDELVQSMPPSLILVEIRIHYCYCSAKLLCSFQQIPSPSNFLNGTMWKKKKKKIFHAFCITLALITFLCIFSASILTFSVSLCFT